MTRCLILHCARSTSTTGPLSTSGLRPLKRADTRHGDPNTPAETKAFVAQAVSQWSHQPQDRYVSIAEEQRMAGGLGWELRHTMQIRDGWRDSSVFSVLANEWPALPA
jgi:hypothetical protein